MRFGDNWQYHGLYITQGSHVVCCKRLPRRLPKPEREPTNTTHPHWDCVSGQYLGQQTYGHVSGACAKALRAVLSSPPGLSLFLSEPRADQHHYPPRDIMEHQETVGKVYTIVTWVLSILAVFILLYIDEIYGPNSSYLGSYTSGGHGYPPEGSNCLCILRKVTARMILAILVIFIWLARLLRRRATWTVILVFLLILVIPVNPLAQVTLTTLTILWSMVTLLILVIPVIVVILLCLMILVIPLIGAWLERRLLPRLWHHGI
ncbi:uncharacterized protein Z519_07110 [Cladophialophora bantiana CBS 173.52]|uniref:Uncharacterized protein n=1 Tax=Cladophialophora bantiana (strain ATCC 10958 / CBS 173.52 / CDC B-1940 / NIH 8579) TaxID=1442370 RepID=A0A0D2EQA5_CLAB1|nr:uncharacterized protein Z519_07110 [Cladophialophora bantiana CBS 173.52]KIW92126.1 hypothetical protein Z519_07110 [Cladophialophora bantiana CBS 173.52]